MTPSGDRAGAGSNGRLRVAMIQTQAEGAGAQEISRLLTRELSLRSYDVTQIFLFRRTASFDADRTARFCATERPRSPAGLIRLLHALHRELRRARPDVVICFQHWGNVIGAAAARMAGVRLIIANQNSAPRLIPRGLRALDRLFGVVGLFSRVVVNSTTTEADYASWPACYRRRLVRIDHGFDAKQARLERMAARSAFGLPTDTILLGSVGRLHPGKNQSAAIRALAQEPDWHLALVGQGPCEAEYRDLARELGCSHRLHLLGERSPAEVGEFLHTLDVFVFPTLAETFGLAAVEAAAAGVPVIANDLPVLREVLAVDGEPCARFTNANDPAVLADAIRSVLSDPSAAAILSARGRSLSSRFPLSSMVDGYEDLIEDLARDVRR